MRKIYFFYFLFTSSMVLHGQVLMNKDSLLKLLPKAKEDTNAVSLYINIGQQYESNEPEVAKKYYRKAGDLSKKLNFSKGIIKYIINYTQALNMQGLYDSSLMLNLQGVKLSQETKDSLNLAKSLLNTGTSYQFLEEFENAVEYYEKGRQLFEKFGNESMEAQCDDVFQVLYFRMRNYRKAIAYGEKSVALWRKQNNPVLLGFSLNNLADIYLYTNKLNKAFMLYSEALNIYLKAGDTQQELTIYLNFGEIYRLKGEYEKFKINMQKALLIAKQLGSHESELMAVKGLSTYYLNKLDLNLSEKLGQEALNISYKYNFKDLRAKLFDLLSSIAYARRDTKSGSYYADQSISLSDSLLNETIYKNTLDIEKRYETEKKVSQIHHLEAEKKLQELSIQKKNIINYFLSGGVFALFFIIFLIYRNYGQKQKLHQQQIVELQTEKQLTATEAVLKGEEQERSRIAKDLHDGLGGMLSGIKYSFTAMKENLMMNSDNQQVFERSIDMLDSSIKEMRRVAHNMMPEALVRFGLDTALRDFCNDINQSGALKVNYQSIGLEGIVLDETTSITLYRIVQELLNNTMKHANAKSAIVQLTKLNEQLSVTVEDDGKGFDTNMLKINKGIGWVNIHNRVEFLKGKLGITSKEGEGTSVLIELKN